MQFDPRYKTLVDLYDRSIEAFRGREAFGTKRDGRWTYVTYGDFGSLVDRFRAGLSTLGVVRGDPVAIIANNRVEWPVAECASYRLGAAFVPMYEAQNPAEWEFIVRDCAAKVLIVANERVLAKVGPLLDSLPTLQKIVLIDGVSRGDARVTTYAALLGSPPSVAQAAPPSSGDVATILYTSGTTGTPKGVILTHGNLASNVSGAHELFPIRPSDRTLSFLPWAHAFGLTAELHTIFSFGASMAICEGMDRILENLVEVRPTILCVVPTIFNRLYGAVQQELHRRPKVLQQLTSMALRARAKERAGQPVSVSERIIVRLVDAVVFKKVRARLGGRVSFAISGGAALSREVAEFIDSIGIVVFEGYGLTETSPVASTNGPGARKIGSVGRAFPGVRIEIDPKAAAEHNADGGPPGREGEVVIHGPNVMKGYFNRPEETAQVFTPNGGFRSGDMGYLDSDQFLFITGRIKEQYKLENGKYVVPSPLEDRLKLSPYITNVMVYGENQPHNVALVVPNLPVVQKWADAERIALPQSAEELAKHPRVRDLFASEISAQSKDFKGFERIGDFALVTEEFTVENGMLTPKMSLKRRKVIEVYGPLITQLYGKGKRAAAGARATG